MVIYRNHIAELPKSLSKHLLFLVSLEQELSLSTQASPASGLALLNLWNLLSGSPYFTALLQQKTVTPHLLKSCNFLILITQFSKQHMFFIKLWGLEIF